MDSAELSHTINGIRMLENGSCFFLVLQPGLLCERGPSRGVLPQACMLELGGKAGGAGLCLPSAAWGCDLCVLGCAQWAIQPQFWWGELSSPQGGGNGAILPPHGLCLQWLERIFPQTSPSETGGVL